MARLFGTDGIRGVAGEDLTADLAFRLGQALGVVMTEKKMDRKVLIGGDTRISGPMLEAALSAGLMSTGIDVHIVGVAPTPVIAFLTRHLNYPIGCVTSASHNPIEDNGIKFFDHRGMKIEDKLEERLEDLLEADEIETPMVTGESIGRRKEVRGLVDEYVRAIAEIGQDKISGMSIVIDAAFGAASAVAPALFTLLGVRVTPMNSFPDGSRINVECGATHPGPLAERTKNIGADMGVALDGDADRAILADENGRIVDGDQILAMWGLHLLRKNALPANAVVGTVLSNKGLEVALEAEGGKLLRAPVGDKYVLRDMQKSGAIIGGEQSGHIIFLNYHTTGDGVLTALMVALLMRETGKPLSVLASQMTRFPQIQLNIEVKDKKSALENPGIKKETDKLSQAIEKTKGRLLVRPSGTESVIRVMTEAPDESTARDVAEKVIDLFRTFSESGRVTEI